MPEIQPPIAVGRSLFPAPLPTLDLLLLSCVQRPAPPELELLLLLSWQFLQQRHEFVPLLLALESIFAVALLELLLHLFGVFLHLESPLRWPNASLSGFYLQIRARNKTALQ